MIRYILYYSKYLPESTVTLKKGEGEKCLKYFTSITICNNNARKNYRSWQFV